MGTPETETDCTSSSAGEIEHSVMAVVFTQIRNVQLVVQQTNYHQRECNRDGLDGIFILFLLACYFPSMTMLRSEVALCISAVFSRPDPVTVPSSQSCD